MTHDTFIFDLDGTVLHTLPDLVILTNKALETMGYPPHTEAEILSYVGNGVKALIDQAIPADADPEKAAQTVATWKSLYATCGIDLTREFEGVSAMLAELKNRGCKLGLLSNKFEGGVKDLEKRYYPGLFDVTHGEREDIPRKPDPTGLLRTIEEMGSTPESTVYVGDSASDMITAHRAGTFALGVTWGYQPLEMLRTGEPDAIVDHVADIISFAPEPHSV